MKMRLIITFGAVISLLMIHAFIMYAKDNLPQFMMGSCSSSTLKEDFADVTMVIALTDGINAYRFIIKDEMKLSVSYGELKSVPLLFSGGSYKVCEITSMDFMGSVSEEAEMVLDADMYHNIIMLAEEVVVNRGDEEEWFSPHAISLVIVSEEAIYQALVSKMFGLVIENDNLDRLNELADMLNSLIPFDNSRMDRYGN